jgi:serine protease Do
VIDLPTRQLMLALCCMLLAMGRAHGQSQGIPDTVLQIETERIETIARAAKSTICVFDRRGQGGGSAVVVSADGYALTNFHVVEPCGPFMKCGLNDGRLYDAVLVGVDPTGDVALLKLLGRDDFVPATWGNSDQLRVGENCFAAGNPFLLAHDYQPTITWGIVCGTNRYQYPEGGILEYADCIQTDAAINPGNSGGPLFNARGELVGINGRGSFEKRGRVNVGVGYAISINQIKHFYSLLKAGRIVDHASLGATFSSNDAGEVRVSNLLDQSDAARQGLRFDDRLLLFAGREINSVNQFKNILGTFPRDWVVGLTVEREGQTVPLNARLAGVNDPFRLDELVNGVLPEGEPKEQDDAEKEIDPSEDLKEEQDADLPVELKNLYKARRGFANFYFNRLETQRVWGRFFQVDKPERFATKWTLSGSVGNDKLQTVLDEQKSGWRLGESIEVLDGLKTAGELPGNRERRALSALHLLRRLVVKTPTSFGDFSSVGQLPLTAAGQLHDVLLGVHDSVECRFFFNPESGRLAMWDVDDGAGAVVCRAWLEGAERPEHWPFAERVRFEFPDAQPILVEGLKLELAPIVTEKEVK